MTAIIPVILSGGSGTRLWPLSTASHPKQFHALIGDATLFEETLIRLSGDLFAPPIVVCNANHLDLIDAGVGAADIAPSHIILEPVGRNTAPAIALAALLAPKLDPDVRMLVAASDSAIMDKARFYDAVRAAAAAADRDMIATFGLRPTRAETGYGYIRRGAPLSDIGDNVFAVDRFIEKPDEATAKIYASSGEHTWNSSMFLFKAGVLLDELRHQRPDILAGCEAALKSGETDGRRIYPATRPFTDIDGESIDYAVMENCSVAAVVESDFGWSDVGSWQALWELSEKDIDGNVASEGTIAIETADCLLRAGDGHRIAVYGCRDLVVVVSGDTVVVAPREQSQNIKRLAESVRD